MGQRANVPVHPCAESHINLAHYHTAEEIGTDTTMNRRQFDYIFTF